MSTITIQAIEHVIVNAAAVEILESGKNISVFDGEATVLRHSVDIDAIMENSFATDETRYDVYSNESGVFIGSVFFIFGNSGWDVLSDNSSSLESYLVKATALSELISD